METNSKIITEQAISGLVENIIGDYEKDQSKYLQSAR